MKDHFDFRRFTIRHDRCAMKVGTDGVLLGAWAAVDARRRTIDAGCGSGLIAIMLAQRGAAEVTGLEIDAPSAQQAEENVAASPYAANVGIVCGDILDYSPSKLFGNFVSNPPFFTEDTMSPNAARAAARSASVLTHAALVAAADRLLMPDGWFQIVVPHSAASEIQALCTLRGFSLLRRTDVLTKEGKQPKRTLLHFVKNPEPTRPVRDVLALLDNEGKRSEEYRRLTADFYLD